MNLEIGGTCHEAPLPLSSLLQDLKRQPFMGTKSPQRTRKQVPVRRASQRTSTPGKGIPEGALWHIPNDLFRVFQSKQWFRKRNSSQTQSTTLPNMQRSKASSWVLFLLWNPFAFLRMDVCLPPSYYLFPVMSSAGLYLLLPSSGRNGNVRPCFLGPKTTTTSRCIKIESSYSRPVLVSMVASEASIRRGVTRTTIK